MAKTGESSEPFSHSFYYATSMNSTRLCFSFRVRPFCPWFARVLWLLLRFYSLTVLGAREGDFEYEKSGAYAKITKYYGIGGTLVIPEKLNGEIVTSIEAFAFAGVDGLTSVTIPSAVKIIQFGGFAGCTNLASVTFPNNLLAIAKHSFANCTSLTDITIPGGVTLIGESVFERCTGLNSVTISNGIRYISESMFSGCIGLTNIIIPDSVIAIHNFAFIRCAGLKAISIPNSVQIIGVSAFENCSGLTSLRIPSGVSNIRYKSFSGCIGIRTVTIPKSVEFFEDLAFSHCSSLTSAFFEGDAPTSDWAGPEFGLFHSSPFVTVFYRSGTRGWSSSFEVRPTALWRPPPEYTDWAKSVGLEAQFPTASSEGDDPDGDRLTNRDERLAGTDPTQRTSMFELDLASRPAELTESDRTPITGDRNAIYFRSVPGKRYGIESARSLQGSWQLKAVTTASSTQTRFVLERTEPEAFYRVLVLP